MKRQLAGHAAHHVEEAQTAASLMQSQLQGGLRISSGLALIGAVVAEFVAGTGGNSTGLAYQILFAGYQLNIPRMFAALLLITLAGVGLFAAMAGLSRWALSGWHDSEQPHAD
mgnify:CR=1 FL=1